MWGKGKRGLGTYTMAGQIYDFEGHGYSFVLVEVGVERMT